MQAEPIRLLASARQEQEPERSSTRALSEACWVRVRKSLSYSNHGSYWLANTTSSHNIACFAGLAPWQIRSLRTAGATTCPLPPSRIVVCPSCSLDSRCVGRASQGFDPPGLLSVNKWRVRILERTVRIVRVPLTTAFLASNSAHSQ